MDYLNDSTHTTEVWYYRLFKGLKVFKGVLSELEHIFRMSLSGWAWMDKFEQLQLNGAVETEDRH